MAENSSSTSFDAHDHGTCIASALGAADQACRENGLRMTPIRRRVLEILLEQHKALGAYDILDTLRAEGHSAQPPVAYRALDFLVEHGFAHRVERLNAFIACSHPGEAHVAAFLICRKCERVAEANVAARALEPLVEAAGFALEAAVVEAEGLCPSCKDTA